MRIVVATGLYPPETGGPATHTLMLEATLPAHGIEVRVVPFSCVRHLPKGIRHVVYLWNVWSAARGSSVVFAQDTLSAGLPAALAARFARRPLVVRVPGDYVWEQSCQRFGVRDDIDTFQTKRYGWRVEFLRRLQRAVVRSAALVITPSNYFHDLVSGWGVPAERIKTIYNGIDLSEEPVPPSALPPRPFMVTAARLVPWKGIDVLINLLTQLPSWQLVIIGEGSQRSALEAAAAAAGVRARVHFTGALTRAEVLGWCAAADAFLLNSRFESFSYQVVEAMYVGVPVITTNIGSLPELIESGTHGLLVEPDDTAAYLAALRSVEHDLAVWRERTDAAMTRAATFSHTATASAIATSLRELI